MANRLQAGYCWRGSCHRYSACLGRNRCKGWSCWRRSTLSCSLRSRHLIGLKPARAVEPAGEAEALIMLWKFKLLANALIMALAGLQLCWRCAGYGFAYNVPLIVIGSCVVVMHSTEHSLHHFFVSCSLCSSICFLKST